MRWKKERAGSLWTPGSFRARAPRALVFGYPASGGLAAASTAVLGPLLAFPFAQGYTVDSTLTGGRLLGGGEVRKVTTLASSGAGSLRTALATPGPADIVFEVGGMIELTTGLEPRTGPPAIDGNLTVWGETAPSPGITIIQASASFTNNYLLELDLNNVVLRHIRFRARHDLPAGVNNSHLGFTRGPTRTIVANCSFARHAPLFDTVDVGDPAADITFYRNLWYQTGKGMLIHLEGSASNVQRLALIQNFWGLLPSRSPTSKAGSKLVRYNDYVYAVGPVDAPASFMADTFPAGSTGTPGDTGGSRWSIRGCQYEANATYNNPNITFRDQIGDFGHKSYFNDNPTVGRVVQAGAVVTAVAAETDLGFSLPTAVTLLSSSVVKSTVLTYAGARPLDRDATDTEAITNATNGTGLQQDTFTAYSLSPSARTLTIPADWNQQAPGEATGWRVLDKWIYQNYTLAVEPT